METEILPKKGKSHRLRQGRTSIPGHHYLVTARRDEASPAFNVPEIAAIILNALKWLEEKSISPFSPFSMELSWHNRCSNAFPISVKADGRR